MQEYFQLYKFIIISSKTTKMDNYQQQGQENYDYEQQSYQQYPELFVSSDNQPYEVIPLSSVFNKVKELVEQTMMTVNLPFGWSLILLRQFKWQTDSLGEYFQNMQKYKILIGFSEKLMTTKKAIQKISIGYCSICCQQTQLIQNICGDNFCRVCWSEHINEHLNSMNPFMKCMNCQAPLLFQIVEQILKLSQYKKIFNRYQKQICQFFTNTSRSYQCCPGIDCSYCIKCQNFSVMTVKCICGKSFCFKCQSDDHSPCLCQQKAKWTDIVLKEEANAKWIAQNTKLCPWCNKAVQRSQGCNFMACLCGKSFCYMCSKPWEPDHKDHFKCHIYKKKNDDEVSRQKAVLQKLNFYAQKYLNTNAVVTALKKVDVFDRRRFLYQKLKIELTQSDFIQQAYKFAIECCQSLKWIYVYSYFVQILDDNRKQRFLFSQGQYQSFKEQLLKKLSHDLRTFFTDAQKHLQKYGKFQTNQILKDYTDCFFNLKTNIINYYRFTKQFKQKFVQQIQKLDTNIIKRGSQNTVAKNQQKETKKNKKR